MSTGGDADQIAARARVALERGRELEVADPRAAEQQYTLAFETGDRDVAARAALARGLLRQRGPYDLPEDEIRGHRLAHDDLTRAIVSDYPGVVGEAALARGRWFLGLDRRAEAERDFMLAIELGAESTVSEAAYERGIARLRAGSVDSAEEDMTLAIERGEGETLVYALFERGCLRAQRGDDTQAEEDFTRAHAIGHEAIDQFVAFQLDLLRQRRGDAAQPRPERVNRQLLEAIAERRPGRRTEGS